MEPATSTQELQVEGGFFARLVSVESRQFLDTIGFLLLLGAVLIGDCKGCNFLRGFQEQLRSRLVVMSLSSSLH